MTDQAGEGSSAVGTRLAILSERYRTAAEADRVLADLLSAAHARSLAARRRLDEIEAEVEALVRGQDTLALDTATGARELQRTLLAKQRAIIAVVSDAAAEDAAEKTVLEGLLTNYPSADGLSTD